MSSSDLWQLCVVHKEASYHWVGKVIRATTIRAETDLSEFFRLNFPDCAKGEKIVFVSDFKMDLI